MLKVRLFGSGQASYDGQPLAGFPNQQACTLLCYLLLNKPHPHNRERLASVFWDEIPTHTARKNLRNALWRLRQTLQVLGASSDDYLYISEDSISFISTSPHWLDVDIFEGAATGCLNTSDTDLSSEMVSDLETAVDLYIGDLLEGTYEDWCLYDRERLRLLYLNALNKLMAYHTVQGDYALGLDYGERLLALDNTQEKVHRQIMWLHWCQGDRSAAVVQYKRCCQILREELGIYPIQVTRSLYEQILSDQVEPSSIQGASPSQKDNLPTSTQILGSNSPIHPLVKHALRKLHRLQHTIEETRVELQQIERLINEAIINSN